MKRHKITSKLFTAVAALLLLLSLGSCRFKPLYIDDVNTHITVSLYDIKLELLWGLDWRTEWKYYAYWDSLKYGTLGYTIPTEQVCAQFYPLDKNLEPLSCWQKHFPLSGGSVEITPGYYNMLFYNDVELKDEHYVTFTDYNDLTQFVATTTSNRDAANTRAADTRNQPDQLFGVHLKQEYVSDDPDDYEYINGVYVYHIKSTLEPYVYIYLIQVLIYNNNDDKGKKVTSGEGIEISGLAKGVEMLERKNVSDTVSIYTDIKPLYTLEADGCDIVGARMQSFGLASIDPLYTRAATRLDVPNRATTTLILRNGNKYTFVTDITDQMRTKITGGVITITLDANNIPKGELDDNTNKGSGFKVDVDDWNGVDSVEVKI